MDLNEAMSFWKKSAMLDKKTSEDLFKSKNYASSLFFVHLYLEKIIKGLVQKETGKIPPFTHDLIVLTKIAGLALSEEDVGSLAVINTFNIRARYADYKFSFYKKATKRFAIEYHNIAKRMYEWFLSQY